MAGKMTRREFLKGSAAAAASLSPAGRLMGVALGSSTFHLAGCAPSTKPQAPRVERQAKFEDYFTQKSLDQQVAVALDRISDKTLAGELRKIVDSASNPLHKQGLSYLVAHLPSEQLAANKGDLTLYVEKMYDLRNRKDLPWMVEARGKIKESVWLQNVLFPRVFGEDIDLKGHLELQAEMLRYLNKGEIRKQFPQWKTHSDPQGPWKDVFDNGMHSLRTAQVLADNAKNVRGVRHYTPTNPGTQGDISISQMKVAAERGVGMRGANFTMMDMRAAAVLGIATSAHHWGMHVIQDVAPCASVVDLRTGKHTFSDFFGEAGNMVGNYARTAGMIRYHNYSPDIIPIQDGHSATAKGMVAENVTEEMVTTHFPNTRYVTFNIDLRDADGKPISAILETQVKASEKDPNSAGLAPVTLTATQDPIKEGTGKAVVAIGDISAKSEDAGTQRAIDSIKAYGTNIALIAHVGKMKYLLSPDNPAAPKNWTAVRLEDAHFLKTTNPQTGKEQILPYLNVQAMPLNGNFFNLRTDHHKKTITVKATLPK